MLIIKFNFEKTDRSTICNRNFHGIIHATRPISTVVLRFKTMVIYHIALSKMLFGSMFMNYHLGGGPPKKPICEEDKWVQKIIGEDSNDIEGIDEGIDIG